MVNSEPYFLVAEDDPDDQFLIQDLLNRYCAEIKTHFLQDGEELMNFLGNEVENPALPNLVLLDLNMPCKDGRTALKEIRTDPRLENLPVVVLTTSSNEKDARFCGQYGIAGFYTKPGSVEELRTIIKDLCAQFMA